MSSFLFELRVGYTHCTLGNHVYYARYLDFIEAARGEFFRAIGRPLLELQGEDLIFPVLECRTRYHAPARYDDVLQISVTVAAISRLKLAFQYEIRRGETLLATAETIHVCSAANEKPKRMPADLEEKLRNYLKQPVSNQS